MPGEGDVEQHRNQQNDQYIQQYRCQNEPETQRVHRFTDCDSGPRGTANNSAAEAPIEATRLALPLRPGQACLMSSTPSIR
jgi:hypothetical protein